MTALRDIQAAFIHNIYTGERTSLAYLDTKIASTARFDIYQNNTVLGLTDILANAFPVLKKIVGDEFFKTIARHYIKSHAQPSGNRHSFGGQLAEFLQVFQPAAVLPYLPDIAALEWAYFQAALADDASPLNFETLTAAMSADPAFTLSIHPSVHVVAQTFNALEIWQEHQKEDIGALELKSEPHHLVVWRGSDDVVFMRSISDALAALIKGGYEGIAFSETIVAAAEKTSDIQKFQQEFAEAVSIGLFAQTKQETLP